MRRRESIQILLNQPFLLAESLSILILIRLVLRLFPFKRIAPYLISRRVLSHGDPTTSNEYTLLVKRVINISQKVLPGTSSCLAQAITAKLLLRKRGIHNSLYLGLAKGRDANLKAHAWLVSDGRIVTGGSKSSLFSVITSFRE